MLEVRIFSWALYRDVAQLVARVIWDHEAAGSRPVIPTGRSVIIGFQKTQIYQQFAGSRQEVFILKIQNDENNAAQQDNGRRFHI